LTQKASFLFEVHKILLIEFCLDYYEYI